jgi:hypothetical protein
MVGDGWWVKMRYEMARRMETVQGAESAAALLKSSRAHVRVRQRSL